MQDSPAVGVIAVTALNSECQGVARRSDGKVIFIDDALPGEVVEYHSYRRKSHFDAAHLQAIRQSSPYRVTPRCSYFGRCGGCRLQHLDAGVQRAMKARWLEDDLWHLAKLKAENWLPPLGGHDWGYRCRARLSVRMVDKKGGLLIGFHEKNSRYLMVMSHCEVLHPQVSQLLPVMQEAFARLSMVKSLPQIEVAVGAEGVALVLRVLTPPSVDDLALLSDFALLHRLQLWLQPAGPDSIYCWANGIAGQEGQGADGAGGDGAGSFKSAAVGPFLSYHFSPCSLISRSLTIRFLPTDFTQVNHDLNAFLVRRALQLLQASPHDRVLDLFCGIGNFTLPLALSAGQVLGVEGAATLVERASDNARFNQLEDRAQFVCLNLFAEGALAALPAFDKVLLDPPREGALEVCKYWADVAAKGGALPQRLVYVSCNPATLARDAGILVHQAGYRLESAGVVNMFAHTAHIESIALFVRQ